MNFSKYYHLIQQCDRRINKYKRLNEQGIIKDSKRFIYTFRYMEIKSYLFKRADRELT